MTAPDWRIAELQKRVEFLEAEIARQNEVINRQMIRLAEMTVAEHKAKQKGSAHGNQ